MPQSDMIALIDALSERLNSGTGRGVRRDVDSAQSRDNAHVLVRRLRRRLRFGAIRSSSPLIPVTSSEYTPSIVAFVAQMHQARQCIEQRDPVGLVLVGELSSEEAAEALEHLEATIPEVKLTTRRGRVED